MREMTKRSMIAVLAALMAFLPPLAGPEAAESYTDHVIEGFDKPVLRAFDPVKRVPVKKVRVQEIFQKPDTADTVVQLRAVDDLVCLKLKPGLDRTEACVLAAVLSPCVCDYAANDLAQKGSDIGGLSGVVSPNGGSCSCK